jgi:putative PEP-CTERM system histidine kinase
MLAHGTLHGIVLLDRAVVVRPLNYEDRDLLKAVGNHIAVHLAQKHSDSLLAEAQQFEAYNRLTAFLMHDLNNLIAQQSLIVENAEQHKRNPEFVDDAIQTISNSVSRMKKVMQQLRRGKKVMQQLRRGRESGASIKTELRFIVSAAVEECAMRQPPPELVLDNAGGSIDVNADELQTIIAHLIRNAQDATPSDGKVTVKVGSANGRAEISIEDSGTGMTTDFIRSRLFRPFDTTKGSQGMGIGAYQAREFVRKMGGELLVDSTVSEGTTIRISLNLSN